MIQRETEHAVRKSGKEGLRWEVALDATSALVSVHDADHTILKVNGALARRLKRAPEEIVGRKCYEVMHATCEPPVDCLLQRALREGTDQRKEFFTPHLAKKALVSISPILSAEGQPTCALHIVMETAEEKRGPVAPAGTPTLSGQQKKILQLLCGGRMIKEIAHQLHMSPRTVEYHKYQMMKKFSARSLSQLVTLALSLGVVAVRR